ncbi:GFA family protein [Devosia sp.]|uniref:GFA family protein n=1 Tax=Devosia sp. TaxID=1871048 RepID=UPI002EF66AED
MSEMFTGGCQCGAVRYRVEGPVRHASICNCRMCQKALGNFMAPFASFAAPVQWTRGQPSHFRSSAHVRRGFCNRCGTPLTYQIDGHGPSLTIGSFDRPDAIMPTVEFARDNRHPVFAHYDELVEEPLGATDEERDLRAILKSYQHPDQDTTNWPPPAASE